MQTLLLDALFLLTSVLESDARGEMLDKVKVVNATKVAIELLHNANAHITYARRVKITLDLNKTLLHQLDEESDFQGAAPALVGTEFAQSS